MHESNLTVLELNPEELELAFSYLVSPELTPPKELRSLTYPEWMAVRELLLSLLEEKGQQTLH